jgi:hypothetical protein
MPPVAPKFLLTVHYRHLPLLPNHKKASLQGFLTLINHKTKRTRLQAGGLPGNWAGFVETGWEPVGWMRMMGAESVEYHRATVLGRLVPRQATFARNEIAWSASLSLWRLRQAM